MQTETLILLLKLLHTAVFFIVSALAAYVLRCGIVGRASARLMDVSIAIPTGVGIAWWLNGHECILSTAIYGLAHGDRSTIDIFLPDWFAQWIMSGTTVALVIAITLVLWRHVTHRWHGR